MLSVAEADCAAKKQVCNDDSSIMLSEAKKESNAPVKKSSDKPSQDKHGSNYGLVKPVQSEPIVSTGGGNINRSASSSSSSSMSSMSKHSSNVPPSSSSPICNDDLSNEDDEVRVYGDEGAVEEEKRCSNTLIEDKIDLCKNSEEKPASNSALPFSVSNLMMASNSFTNPYQSTFNAAGFAAAAAAQLHRQSLYNSALYSSELAHHFASWWPTVAAAGVYGAHQNPFAHFSAAAALSRFNPSLFMPPQSPQSAGLNPSSSSSSSSSSNHMAASSPFSLSSNRSTSSTSSTSSHHNQHKSHHHSDPSAKAQQYGQGQAKKKPRLDDGRPLNNGHHSSNMANHHQHHHNGQNGMMANHEAQMHKHMQSMLQSQQPPPQMNTESAKSKKPHVKKPLNAFMLFMKEQRAQVVSECTLRESAAINQILGRKWHELDKAEQSKYYEMARQERLNHIKLYPEWSARDNYGIKKKGKRKREKVIGDNSDLPRKCRARFGVHQINMWCKPCRRKKKCIRFSCLDDPSGKSGGGGVATMGPNGQMIYTGGNYCNGSSVGEGSSGGAGSGANSLNGANSDEEYEDDSDCSDDDVDDLDEDDLDDDDGDEDRTHTQDDLENKSHHMSTASNKTPTNNHRHQLNNSSGRTKSLQNSNKLNHHHPMKQEFDLAGMSNMMASFGANGMLPNLLPGGHNMFYNEINNQLNHLQQQAFHFNAQ